MKRRILVTGGAGFLGSHLCERLIQAGNEVLCLDNFFTGNLANVRHLQQMAGFEVLRHDIIQPIYLEIDWIFNLACPASPVAYQYNPIKTMKTSVLGAMNMLGLAKRTGARLLHASTSEIYGDPLVHPQTESYWGHANPTGRRACYDEGKRCAEALLMDYHRQHGVDIRIARLFNVYGPRMALNDGRVVSNFICQAIGGQPLTVYGNGSQTRSFCFVDDLIEGFLALMSYEGAECHEPHNLGNPQEMTILQLVEQLEKAMGRPLDIVHAPLPEDDPKQRQPDITRARHNLGWEPKVSLQDGIARSVEDFRRRLAAQAAA